MDSLVSILIPIYNRIDMYSDSIESALCQDYPNIEVIVVDNNSTDGTYDAIKKKYGNNDKIKIYKNDKNLGPVGNWISCLDKSNGKYIKFLWSDDLIERSFIRKAVRLLETDDDIAFAFTSVMRFHEILSSNPCEISKKDILNNHGPFFLSGQTGIYNKKRFINGAIKGICFPVSPGCALIRRDSLNIVTEIEGTCDYDFMRTGAGPDLLMFLEAFNNKNKYAFINEPLSYFRWHEKSISLADRSIMMGYLEAKKHYVEKNALPNLKKFIVIGILGYERGYKLFPIGKSINCIRKYYANYNVIDLLKLLPVFFAYIFNKLLNKCGIKMQSYRRKLAKDYRGFGIKTKW